ncbi:thioredoxin-dependent thiol peroxidase [Candidatus Saccharibacteria bacterium]|nr:thioredoxin-dependent thiol peroxidase [Candidatus Saccharibacteria bacterium]
MKAPDFNLPDQNGQTHQLSDYAGKWLVVYFYPKDSTPGCTVEACAFRDGRDELLARGVEVVGISKDSVASHAKFADKHELNFTLLSDESATTIQAYGAWAEKSMFGKKYMGILRNTYLINPEGEVVKTYKKVSPKDHYRQILTDLEQLQG